MSHAEVAATMLSTYGSYPIASTFEMTDSSPRCPSLKSPPTALPMIPMHPPNATQRAMSAVRQLSCLLSSAHQPS